MEYFNISARESELHIEGFPDAVKVISVNGQEAKRIADLALHKADLEFANACLDAINTSPKEPFVIREALWRSAVIHFMKCYGNNNPRFQLSHKKILKNEALEASIAFEYFKSLRNKHFIHDENSYTQSIPGAILNDGNKAYKIEKIVCLSAIVGTLEQDNYGNLKLLIDVTLSWVTSKFDELCNIVTTELERESYDNLYKKESVKFKVPSNDELNKKRN